MIFLIASRGRTLKSVDLERLERRMESQSDRARNETAGQAKLLREELAGALHSYNEAVAARLTESTRHQLGQLESFSRQLQALTQSNEQKLEKMRETIELRIKALQDDNSSKIEVMRQTVDEKLHATLEKRLGESFQRVSERLEQVHKGLGEMQTLASGVGDLKRVLTNVKTRGTWGEIQLGTLLEQILAPEQYAQNVATKHGSSDRVEFAVRMPGRDAEGIVYLPIDAKFPQEDYLKLLEAQDMADAAGAEAAAKALENRIKAEAKDISLKYLDPPHTTDFGLMFLPVEGLFAEIIRRPGLCDILSREYRVVVAGPTTLAAFLNSLQMGFRTLAVEKRSSEVWKLLGAVKTEFGSFGDILDKTRKKLEEASHSIDTAAKKSRRIHRQLRDVQELPGSVAANLIEAGEEPDEEK